MNKYDVRSTIITLPNGFVYVCGKKCSKGEASIFFLPLVILHSDTDLRTLI